MQQPSQEVLIHPALSFPTCAWCHSKSFSGTLWYLAGWGKGGHKGKEQGRSRALHSH
jgi:hypothetical protein